MSQRPAVWIINPYGTLPAESWAAYRSTMMAERLAEEGFEVTQFISNFEHRSKTFRARDVPRVAAGEHYAIRIVPSRAYQTHISFARIAYERTFARNLVRLVRGEGLPEFVILAEPSLFYYDLLLDPVLRRSRLVVDLIDLWPELFELVIPRRLRPMSGLLLGPLFWWRRRLYDRARGVIAVSEDYLEVARKLVAAPGVLLEVVYWGYEDKAGSPPEQPVASPLDALIGTKRPGEVWVVYAGTLGENYDIPSILESARALPQVLGGRVAVRFLVAGDGPLAARCRDAAIPNLTFLGRLAPRDVDVLLNRCDVALVTYKGESTVSMPIKAFDYLRHGLPMVNSLGRDLGALVERHGLGVNYRAGSGEALGAAIERLAVDDAFRARCAANARALAPRFSSTHQYGKVAAMLRALLHPPASTQ